MLTTRSQIIEAAEALFARQSYHGTSVREIAERLGLTKTAVLYHFPTKADILAALAEPFLDDFEAALRTARSPREVVEGVLDTHLRHRHLLRNNLVNDLALLAQESVARRYPRLMLEANRLVAGPHPDLREKVRAAQAVAVVTDPVILHADERADLLRAEVLRGVALLYP